MEIVLVDLMKASIGGKCIVSFYISKSATLVNCETWNMFYGIALFTEMMIESESFQLLLFPHGFIRMTEIKTNESK